VSSASGGYFFRLAPPLRLEGAALAELVLADAHRRVAIVRRDDAFGEEIAATAASELAEGGAAIVMNTAYDPGNLTTAALVADVADARPDALLILGAEPDGAAIVHGLASAGLGPGAVATYVSTAMESTTFGTSVDPADPGVVAGIKGTAPAEAPFGTTSPFHQALRARGVDPVFSAQTYDCTILVGLAAVKAGSDSGARFKHAFTANLEGKNDCETFATCSALLEHGKTIHWRGASSSFDTFGAFEPKAGTFDVWSYDTAGRVATEPESAQIKVG
jgi:branched-chain amino acid transport system substrate-binding protein